MKSKLFNVVIYSIVLSLLLGATVLANNENETVGEAQSFIDGILAYKCTEEKVSSVQEFINTYLVENAGVSADWYAIGLSQYGKYQFESYKRSLLEYITQNDIASASTRQRLALALIATGSDSTVITDILNSSIGKQGIMSWVYGLHILNNGYTAEEYTIDDVIKKIMSMQLSDGGFALSGENGDVDVTAMTIQSLAPYYEREDVRTAVDNALFFLSSRQKENGDFVSYGVNNPESASQVLVALCSLGIDFRTDERFIKNGNDLFDSIARFRLKNGGFCHKSGGAVNGNATVQVFYSMVAYIRMTEGKSPLYIFDNDDYESDAPVDNIVNVSSDSSSDTISDVSEESIPEETKTNNYKLWICIGIIVVFCVICGVMLALKKRNKQNYMFVAVMTIILIFAVCLMDIESPEEHYSNLTASKENICGTVSITIHCDVLVGKTDESYVPLDGIVLKPLEIAIEEGDTVYDVLLEAAAKNNIPIETNGISEGVYVEGIANIYEFDFGDLSGWTYFVNGEKPSVSCSEYVLQPDDIIEWQYSLSQSIGT